MFAKSFVTLVLMLALQPAVSADDIFRDQVAPIFQTHCVSCHNQVDAKGDFSLETADAFFDGGFVEIGSVTASHLVDLITAKDGQRAEMPKSGRALSTSQVLSIKQWINDGAKWPAGYSIAVQPKADFEWWSLKPLERPKVPAFQDTASSDWIRNPVDAFVLNSLNRHGLSPSPAADRRTLLRRLSYDLTGLPPTMDEIKDFEADLSDNAYEKQVDRLLASPRYGERWARHWLDVVKYADTCGYDKDKLRPHAWPYRDYVVRSFNDDKPYRRFVREQIAGDSLYPGTADGILGLGFIAAGPWDFIGHVEVPEAKIDGQVARNLDRDDMVSNSINTFCSVTIQCARCHDHKFDPFTQEHYYGLQAVFAAVDRADRVYQSDPEIEAQRQELQPQMAEHEERLADIETLVTQSGGDKLKLLDARIVEAKPVAKRAEFGYHSQVAASVEVEKWVELNFEQPQMIDHIILRPCHDEFNNIGAGFGFPIRFRVEADGETVFDQTNSDFANPKLKPVAIPVGKISASIRIVATRLAERQNDFHFALAEVQVINRQGDDVAIDAKVTALDSIEAPVRWRKTNLNDGIWFEPGDDLETLQLQRTEFVESLLGKPVSAERADLQKRVTEVGKKLSELPRGKLVYAASTEFSDQGNFKPTRGVPRDVRLLTRGDVTSPGETIRPGVLPLREDDSVAIQLKANATEAERRAALALWLTSDENPLTWRSIVNRVWHYHFGRGIVDTPNDFGRMGGERTHPELLDWLAIEFRDGDQSGMGAGSLKRLHRILVTSSVYRQSSGRADSTTARLAMATDSGNRLLWKMNRRRLSAEEIRDSILMASGTLDLKMGGPGYYLFALEKTEHSPHYEYHKFDHSDPNSYRRSIYRFIVRSQPDPFMTTLDCADSSQSTPARNETQTPLQSLSMLNSDFNLVMAKKMAARLQVEADSMDDQIELAMNLVVGRAPTESELKLMTQYAGKHGLENLVRILFNQSEFVYVD